MHVVQQCIQGLACLRYAHVLDDACWQKQDC